MTPWPVTLVLWAITTAVSLTALWYSRKSYVVSLRPMLRPVRVVPSDWNVTLPSQFRLKNIGRGWALSVRVFAIHDRRHTLLASVDAVEPLGAKGSGKESERAGNQTLWIDPEWTMGDGEVYRVVYQDIDGRWHESRFTFRSDREFLVTFLGPVPSWRIPIRIRDEALVETDLRTGIE